MQQTANESEKSKTVVYKNVAPYLPGLYGVQALGDDLTPDVTVYRTDTKEVAAWIKAAKQKNRHGGFLVRHGLDKVDVYDKSGTRVSRNAKLDEQLSCLPEAAAPAMEVDASVFLREAAAVLPDGWSCMASCMCHAGVSSASHSNFVMVMRDFILEADPKDLAQVAVIESHKWNFRVMGVFAHVPALSSAAQDRYLDRYRWLSNGWPLHAWHFKQTMAYRLSTVQKHTLADVASRVCRLAGKSPEYGMAVKLHVVSLPHEARMALAAAVIERVGDKLEFPEDQRCETFSDEQLKPHADQLMQLVSQSLA